MLGVAFEFTVSGWAKIATFVGDTRPRSRPHMHVRNERSRTLPQESSFSKGAAKPSEDGPVMLESPPGCGKGVDATVPSMRSVKSVTSDNVRRIQMNNSSAARTGNTDLNDLMSESANDVESTCKEAIPLSPEGFLPQPFGISSDDRFPFFE